MPDLEPIGIKGVEALHFYVNDLDRFRGFMVDQLDFEEFGSSSADLEARGKQRSVGFRAGEVTVLASMPVGLGGRASRFLAKHPDGVGTIVFEVEDIDKCFALLGEREATFINDIQRFEDEGGTLAYFSITTAFGNTTIRFVERHGYTSLFPGFENYAEPKGGTNKFGFSTIDHITSNFETMKPALLWMEHVLGFKRYWDVEFHTNDVALQNSRGSGLRSIVMHDPHSGVKFANNEPWRPFFKKSQINVFAEDHRGDGIQHVAMIVPDIIGAVRGLRDTGLSFMPTPDAYYDNMPGRLKTIGVQEIDEDIEVLRELKILVDGEQDHAYMLQIFTDELATQFKSVDGGPFFFEVIQRKGDRGFGAGNFRALFESIERVQEDEGRI